MWSLSQMVQQSSPASSRPSLPRNSFSRRWMRMKGAFAFPHSFLYLHSLMFSYSRPLLLTLRSSHGISCLRELGRFAGMGRLGLWACVCLSVPCRIDHLLTALRMQFAMPKSKFANFARVCLCRWCLFRFQGIRCSLSPLSVSCAA